LKTVILQLHNSIFPSGRIISNPANPYEPTTSTVGELFATQGKYDGLADTAIGLKIIYFSILLMLLCIKVEPS